MKHFRGILILIHLIAISIAALPAPIRTERALWAEPTMQFELAQLSERLGRWGIEVPASELEDRLWSVSERYAELNERARAPFGPYYTLAGTGQAWAMFAGADHFPCTVAIDVRVHGAWMPVYETGSPAHRWNKTMFEHLAFRYMFFLYDLPGFQDRNDGLLELIARDAARDFPSAEAVRLRYVERPIPSPKQVRDGSLPPPTERLVYTRELTHDVPSGP